MTWSFNAAWLRDFNRAGVVPRAIVEIGLQPSLAFTVVDYSGIAPGNFIVFQGVAVVEGTDWNATTSNLVTANNIAQALRDAEPSTSKFRFQITTNASGHAIVQCIDALDPTPSLTVSVGGPPNLISGPTFPDSALFSFADGPISGLDAPNSVRAIRGLEMTVDPVTREFSASSVEIEFIDDGMIRELASRYMLLGRSLGISIGSENLSVANFEPWPSLIIDSIRALPNRGGIIITAGDTSSNLKVRQLTGRWVNEHPLDVMADVFTQCGVSYDSTSFDPADAANDSIGHYVISRYDDQLFQYRTQIDEPTSALDLASSLMPILGGTSRLAQDGSLTYAAYDPDATAVRVLSRTIDPEQFQVEVESVDPGQDGIINAVAINHARKSGGSYLTFREQDERSIAEIGRRVEITLDSEWLNAVVTNTINNPNFSFDGTYSYANLIYASRQGFCGSRWRNYPSTQETWAELNDTTKLAFLSLTSFTDTSIVERVAFDSVEAPPFVDLDPDQPDSSNVRSDIPLYRRYNVAASYNDLGFTSGRGGLGSNGTANSAAGVVDVTIQHAICERILRRFRYGAPVIVVRAPVRHLDLEVGDIVQLNDPDLLVGFLLDDATVLYEITRKTVRAFEDDPCVEFELVFFRAEDNVVYEAVVDPIWEDLDPVTPESDVIVTNDGDPVWSDIDGDGSIEAGDDELVTG